MDIHNSIDGKGLKATNFADGTADTDLATVGQLGGGSPVIFVGGISSGVTVWSQTSTNTNRSFFIYYPRLIVTQL